jgi:hypothetical protein
VPLTLRVDPSGAIVATLGSAPEVTPNARFGPNVIRWTMSGHLGVEGEPFDLATRLCPRDRVLAAAAQTVPAANHPVAFLTYYSVRAHDDDQIARCARAAPLERSTGAARGSCTFATSASCVAPWPS